MFKNLLIKLANIIIDKYGIHILNEGTIIQLYDMKFEITSYQLSKNYNSYTSLRLEATDILHRLGW